MSKIEINREKYNKDIICPCCGATNPTESENCEYCGYTLVDIEINETQKGMTQEQFLKGKEKFTDHLINDLNKFNKDWKDQNKGGQISDKTAHKMPLYITIGIMICISIAFIGIRFSVNTGEENIISNLYNNSMILFMRAIRILSTIIIIFIVIRVFTYRKNKNIKYMKKCPNCGGNNKLESKICSYCSSNLENVKITEDSLGISGEKAEKEIIKNIENISNYIYDKINKND